MNADRFKRIDELFNQVRELQPEQRGVFLGEQCGDDAELRQEVEALLGFDEKPQAYLRTPVLKAGMQFTMGGIAAAPWQKSYMPERVGAYRVIRAIGEGGFGVVYLAEQENPRRTVALKVMKPHLSSPQLFRRFEYEAQVLARLQHPGIAQIYEAGTSSGPHGVQAFFAMEYIQGKSLDAYVRDNALTVPQRLELFARVCDAVQYAHQRGVIHRDLKPGNILVPDENAVPMRDATGRTVGEATPRTAAAAAQHLSSGGSAAQGRFVEPPSHGGIPSSTSLRTQPKVLDFGVAKVMDSELEMTTMRTSTGQFIGTLPYMSPEQVAGNTNDVDTRSDVYALGVILYQILAGVLPFDFRSCSVPEAARRIRDEDPVRLGTINRSCRGEVETIVARALMKDKRRRYQSAADLAADLRRYLAGEPIEAKRDSTLYVLRKQLRRYWAPVTIAAMFMAFVIWFGVYASMQSRSFRLIAEREARAGKEAVSALNLAEQQRQRADKTAASLRQQLSISNIERGRLFGRTGVTASAEQLLWRERLLNPKSLSTYWALWELYSRDPWVTTLQAYTGWTQFLRFTPDDRTLISCGGAGVIKLWDTSNWTVYHEFPADNSGWLGYLELSPNGRWLATAGRDKCLRVWDMERCELAAEFEGFPTEGCHMAFSSDSKLLAGVGWEDNRLRVWDMGSMTPVVELPTFARGMHSCAFAPGSYRLAASGRDARLRVWDDPTTDSLELAIWRMGNGNPGRLVFSDDGRRLFMSGADRIVRCFDTTSGAIASETQSPNDTVNNVFPSSIQGQFASSGWWNVTLWNSSDCSVARSITTPEGPLSCAFTSDGRMLAVGSGTGSLRVHELNVDRARPRFEGNNTRTCARITADGKTLATGDNLGWMRIWDVASHKLIAEWRAGNYRIWSVRFDPNGERVATAGGDRLVRIWNYRTGECVEQFDWLHARNTNAIDWSPDGSTLAYMGVDQCVHLIDIASMAERKRFYADDSEVLNVSYSHSGRNLMVFCRNGPLHLLDAEGNEQLSIPFNGTPWTAAFSPDDLTLAVGSWNRNVELFDLRSGATMGQLEGYSSTVWSVAFHPRDGRLLASTGADGIVRLFDIEEQRQLLALDALAGGEALCVNFNGDGSKLCAANSVGTAVVWDLNYFDRHVAGQADYQARLLRDALDQEPGGAPARVKPTDAAEWSATAQ